jgi:hypothetical protein
MKYKQEERGDHAAVKMLNKSWLQFASIWLLISEISVRRKSTVNDLAVARLAQYLISMAESSNEDTTNGNSPTTQTSTFPSYWSLRTSKEKAVRSGTSYSQEKT